MIDRHGYRANVGIVITDGHGKLFWARRRTNSQAWQFPQGGLRNGETAEEALFRELYEETGLTAADVKILGATSNWLRYKLPSHLIRRHSKPICIGQKQRWFLLELISSDSNICLGATNSPEFDTWQWVEYWYPLKHVIHFKYAVYKTVLKYFAKIIQPPPRG